jgi:hypothetical protein
MRQALGVGADLHLNTEVSSDTLWRTQMGLSHCIPIWLHECLPALQHDPHRPEDVLKVDADEEGNGGDDAGDRSGIWW